MQAVASSISAGRVTPVFRYWSLEQSAARQLQFHSLIGTWHCSSKTVRSKNAFKGSRKALRVRAAAESAAPAPRAQKTFAVKLEDIKPDDMLEGTVVGAEAELQQHKTDAVVQKLMRPSCRSPWRPMAHSWTSAQGPLAWCTSPSSQ